MGIIQKAIARGIEEGLEQAVADRCDGYDDPQDRCMMRPKDGCACLRVRWRKSNWWQFVKEPMKPAPDAVIEAIVNIAIENNLGGSVLPKINIHNSEPKA